MNERYLFVMLGFLGSGKSYVSRWLTPHTKSVYIRVDALRLAMFGEDRPELYLPENKALVNEASYYMIEQVLESGRASVVYDANNNQVSTRQTISDLARKHEAKAIVVYIETPLDIAKQRTVERRETEGHVLFEPNLVEKMAMRLEAPTDQEAVIYIDGLQDAASQQVQFDEQFARLQADRLQ